MAYRDLLEAELDDPRPRDVVLAQHSTMGPLVVLGLGVVFASFLAYLIYANLLMLAPAPPSLERLQQPDALAVPALARRSGSRQFPGGVTVTVVPQRWATNALLGGTGPALPLEQLLESPGLQRH